MTTFSIAFSYHRYTSQPAAITDNNISEGDLLVVALAVRTGQAYTTLTVTDNNSKTWNYAAGLDNELANSNAQISFRFAYRVVEADEDTDNLTMYGAASGSTSVSMIVVRVTPSAAYDWTLQDSSAAGSGTATLDGVSTSTGSVSGSDLFHVFSQAVRQASAIGGFDVDEYTVSTEYDELDSIKATNTISAQTGVVLDGQANGTFTVTSNLSAPNVADAEGVIGQLVFSNGAVSGVTGTGAATLPVATISGTGLREITGSGGVSAPVPTLDGSGEIAGAISGTGAISSLLPVLSGAGYRGSVGTGAITSLLPVLSGNGHFELTGSGAVVTWLPILSGTTISQLNIYGTIFAGQDSFGAGTMVTGQVDIDGAIHQTSDWFGSGTVFPDLFILGSLHATPDTFGTGTFVPYQIDITGSFHSSPDSFGSGTVVPDITSIQGVIHQASDWFGAGVVIGSGSILGSFHATSDSFGQATLVPGDVYIDGVLHSTPDTFGAGLVQHVTVQGIDGAFHSSPDTFGTSTAVQYIGGYFHSTIDTFPIKRFVAFGSGLGVPLETWAEWQQLIRLPIMESDISDLQRDLWSLSAEFTNHVIENEYDFSVHSTLIGIADDKAEHAESVADDVAADIVSARFEAKAYTDTLIQLLRDELTAAFTAADTAVTATLPTTVETEIDAAMAQLQTDLDNARADALAAAALAQSEHAEMVSLTETMLFTTIPGLQNQADTSTSAIDALRMEYDLLLTDFDEASLLAKFDSVDAEIAVSVANLKAVIEDPNGDSVGAALLSFQVAQTTVNEATALDVSALQASVGDLDAYATAITDLNVNDLTGTAFATMLSDLEVDANGNTAGISDFRAVEATLNDRSASVLAFETYTEGSNSFLRLGSYGEDLLDPAGNFAAHSNIYMKADDILLDGDVSMNKLVITDLSGNIVPNGNFTRGLSGWSPQDLYIEVTNVGSSSLSSHEVRFNTGNPTNSELYGSFLPIEGSTIYTFSFAYWAGMASMPGYAAIHFYDKDLTYISGWAMNIFAANWNTVSQEVTAPSNARYAQLYFRKDAAATAVYFYITGVSLIRKRSGTTVISDGTILTQHMTANTINGDRMQANTLNASKITAGTVTYDRLVDNTLNGNTWAYYSSGYTTIGSATPVVTLGFTKYASSSLVLGAQGFIRIVMGTTMDYLYVRIRNYQNSEAGQIAIPVTWDSSLSMDLYVGFCAPFIVVPAGSVSFGVEAWTENGKSLLANNWKIAVLNNYHG